MVNQCTKFEVSRFTRCEVMNGGAKCTKWGSLGHLRITQSNSMPPFDRAHTTSYSTSIETTVCVCLLPFSRYSPLLVKCRRFYPPHLHSAPSWGVTPVELRGHLWLEKTRVPGLSCGVVCVIHCLAVLVELRLVTDGQRDRQTDRHGPMASTADA